METFMNSIFVFVEFELLREECAVAEAHLQPTYSITIKTR